MLQLQCRKKKKLWPKNGEWASLTNGDLFYLHRQPPHLMQFSQAKKKKHKRNGLQKRRIKSVLFVAAAFVRFRVFLLLFSVHFQIVSLALYAVLFNSFFTFFAVVVWGCKCAIKETGYTPINLEMLATSSPPFVAIVSTWLKCSHNVAAAAAAAKMYSYSYSHVLMLTAFLWLSDLLPADGWQINYVHFFFWFGSTWSFPPAFFRFWYLLLQLPLR